MKRTIKIETASFLSRPNCYLLEVGASLQAVPKHCQQVLFALAFFVLCPMAQAVSPAPDGGYPGGNTAEGQNALLSLTTGTYNTGLGLFSLRSVTTGQFNTATGAGTLLANTADQNTATGAGALLSNTTGFQNTAIGTFALFSNSSGNHNTANGVNVLFSNTTGGDNTAVGADALSNNSTGTFNTAMGFVALQFNTTGIANTAVGSLALQSNITGQGNTALGFEAGLNITGDNNIDIGSGGVSGESNTIRIGNVSHTNTFVAAVFNHTTTGTAVPVVIDATGELGTISSSRRFKKEIKPMDSASEAILALKPVTFHYKSDTRNAPQFGLIAEEVATVNPDLVVRDEKGKIYTVRYDAVNAMLLNEFLKEHKKVETLEAALEAVNKRLKEHDVKIDKVSARFETRGTSPRIVANK